GRTKLVVSTTTSLYDTGLLDIIEDRFEAKHPIDIYFIAAGTGIAIQYAQRGDADMILVHAPSKERLFLEEGYGVCRKIVAYNFFTIVGPEEDPAEINGLTPVQALINIVDAGRQGDVSWVSRGDDSGTHTKEKALWAAAGFDWTTLREETWYVESGAGMGTTLQISDETSAYTLADMGTYLKYYTDQLISLKVFVEEGKELLNVYSVIAVNEAYNSEVKFNASITFIKFLVSDEGQQIIDQFGHGVYSQKLFYPVVELLKENTDLILVGWIQESAYFDGSECPPEYQDNCKEIYS
ncbi:MAG: substrate-binding domain-containing protein, partial [Candidatus Bathyarchaeota archaeon]